VQHGTRNATASMHLIGAFAANALTQLAEDVAVQSVAVLESILKGYGLMRVDARIVTVSLRKPSVQRETVACSAHQCRPGHA
jgi:hypothetical protein